MTKSTRLQIRIAPDEKAQAEELFERLGLTTSSAVNLFIKQSLRVGGLPFNLGVESSDVAIGDKSNLE